MHVVDVPTLQPQQLCPAELAPCSEKHRHPKWLGHCCRQRIDLSNRCHRTLRRFLLTRSPHQAGISGDQLIRDGRGKNPPHQPVCLGPGHDHE
jgi:hypothetical protein